MWGDRPGHPKPGHCPGINDQAAIAFTEPLRKVLARLTVSPAVAPGIAKEDLMRSTTKRFLMLTILAASACCLALTNPAAAQDATTVRYRTLKVSGLDIFYREAGPKNAPAILLLHGFPTSSQMYRNLIPLLADRYHVIAPDYPGFGHSSMPARDKFTYSFDNLAKVIDEFTEKVGLKNYALYVQDYGAPVGNRLAVMHPARITAIVVQNGNAYDEGLDNDFWKPIKAYWNDPHSKEKRDALRVFLKYDATKWQYTQGVKNLELVSPDGPAHDQFLLDRTGNDEIQLDLLLSYGSNPPLYPKWQDYFRTHQPPMLIVWGKNDPIFPAACAEPYKRDLKTLEFHLLDAGHFALETNGPEISRLMNDFLGKHLIRKSVRKK
jgi:pimeloyl-ACP methyl ester carboxylesterase